MKNPTVYFEIYGNSFIPVNAVLPAAASIFNDKKVITANIAGYNNYTKSVISKYLGSNEIFVSNDYEYSSASHTFNFYEIHECSEEDYNNMGMMQIENSCEFDLAKDYGKEAPQEAVKQKPVTKTKALPINARNIMEEIKAKYPCPTVNDNGFYVDERNWNFLVRNIMKHINTILIGPTGTGKTEIIMRICEMMGIECHVYDMGSMQDPLTDLLGSHRIVNGNSVFDYSKFVEDVQKPGVILLDELSRAPLSTNNILFPCLDSRRTLPVEIADSHNERTIKVHPECTFIATANIGSEYAGTNDIDAALLNRFLPIQLDYLPTETEIKVLVKRTGIDSFNAEKIISFVNIIRGKYMQGDLSKSVSTRESLACAEMFVDGFALIDCIEYIIANKYINNNYNNEYTMVKQIIMEF